MKPINRVYVLPILLVFLAAPLLAEAPRVKIGLQEAEEAALRSSARYQAAQKDAEAAVSRAETLKGQSYPRLALEGSYRYNTVVPELQLPIPGAPSQSFGDNTNYSLGPSISWTLFDAGALRNAHRSARAAADAKALEAESVRRQVLLGVRTSYFQLALAAEQVVLVSDALKLAERQYEDIRINVRAGTKSRMDELSARQELLARKRQLSQARAGMAAALRDLSAYTGTEYCAGQCVPWDSRIEGPLSGGIPAPTVILVLEPVDRLSARFMPSAGSPLWEGLPGIAAFDALAESARRASASAAAGFFPRLQLSARSSLDYPNGPKLEQINQNSAGLALSWTLFDGGQTPSRVRESDRTAEAAGLRKEQAASDLARDWTKTKDRLENLVEQRELDETAVRLADELLTIVYASYRSGSLTYLEVQNASFRLLEAKIQLAQTKAQMLMQLAVLASMSETDR